MSSRDPGVLELVGLTEEEADVSVWTVGEGVRFGGAAAVALAVAVAWGSSLPLQPWRVPGFASLADATYDVIARNRHRIP